MNIFKLYKKYKESNKKRKELKKILKWIKRAKKAYIERNFKGMCISFVFTSEKVKLEGVDKDCFYILLKDIHIFIPEFNPEFLNATMVDSTTYVEYNYWWPKEDRESRIKAFDKLITLYKSKLKE